MRRIAVATGSRADFGLLLPVLTALRRTGRATVQLIPTGSHLDPRFGRTLREVEAAGFRAAARVPLSLRGDSPRDIAEAMGRAVSGFARAYAALAPELLVVLGDRWEILAAASAALPFRIPVAHIHGGEATEGLIDEQVRHAVTKLSHLHFPVAEAYRRRLLSLGEDPRRVFCFGAPGLDGLWDTPFWGRDRLWKDLGIPPGREVGIATHHPVTLSRGAARRETTALLAALARRPSLFWVLTLPNAEAEFASVIRLLRRFARARPDLAVAHPSLGRERYLSLLRLAKVVVGNSSSGLLEAPSFRLPTVNIGDRQKGRLRAASVIDVPRPNVAAISAALARALSPSFRARLGGARNPYQGRQAARRIAKTLVSHPLGETLLHKSLRER